MRPFLVLVPLLVSCADSPTVTYWQMPLVVDPTVATARLDWSTVPDHLDTGEMQRAFTEALSNYGMHEGDGGVLVRWSDMGTYALGWAHGDTIDLSTYYRWTLGDCEPYSYDVESVLLHELGHMQGLGHTDEGIMAPAIGHCEVKRVCVP